MPTHYTKNFRLDASISPSKNPTILISLFKKGQRGNDGIGYLYFKPLAGNPKVLRLSSVIIEPEYEAGSEGAKSELLVTKGMNIARKLALKHGYTHMEYGHSWDVPHGSKAYKSGTVKDILRLAELHRAGTYRRLELKPVNAVPKVRKGP